MFGRNSRCPWLGRDTPAHSRRRLAGKEGHVDYLRIVVRNLRQKIELDPVSAKLIINELGIGYRFMADSWPQHRPAGSPEFNTLLNLRGLALGRISTLAGAMIAMRTGSSGDRLGKARRPQPTIVFHGDKDNGVHPANASGFLTSLQKSRSGPLTCQVRHGRSNGGRDFTRRIYRTDSGTLLLEDWTVHGCGHAWSGGKTAGSHTDPDGPDAAREMVRFFLTQAKSVGENDLAWVILGSGQG